MHESTVIHPALSHGFTFLGHAETSLFLQEKVDGVCKLLFRSVSVAEGPEFPHSHVNCIAHCSLIE